MFRVRSKNWMKLLDRNVPSKYRATAQVYNDIRYDSKLEANYAAELDWRIKAGDIKSWERQVKIPLDVNGLHITNYYIDFIVEHNDGLKEYVEVKGFETPVWQLKWRLFEALYSALPNVSLTVVK